MNINRREIETDSSMLEHIKIIDTAPQQSLS